MSPGALPRPPCITPKFRWSSCQASSPTERCRSERKVHRRGEKSRSPSCESRRVSTTDINPNASIVSLISPFTRRSLKIIKDALSAAYATKYPIKLTETHAVVLVPLWNLNGNPGSLPEVREKARADSGEVRWTHSRFTFVDFHPC